MNPRSKRADEIFCHSCGEIVKKQVKFCSHCGARNSVGHPRAQPQPPQPQINQTHDVEGEVRDFVDEIMKIGDNHSSDRTRLEERISGVQTLDDMDRAIDAYHRVFFQSPPETVWWKGTVGATVAWVAYFAASDLFLSFDFLFLITFAAWILLPVSIYKDSKIAPEYTVNWRPSTGWYIIGAAIPGIAAVSGIVYLINRWYHGNNQELDDVDAERQKYEQMIPEVSDIGAESSVEETSSTTS